MTFREWIRRLPWSIVGLAVALAVLGFVALVRVEELTESPGRFLPRQILWAVVGFVAMLSAAWPSYQSLCRASYVFYGLVMIALVAVFVFPPLNGAHRWLRLGWFTLQPSEIAKIAFVVALARYLMYRDDQRRIAGLLMPLVLAVVPMFLILREPDLGTSLVFLPVLFAMLWASGARGRDLAITALAGLMLTPILWSQMSREQRSRITAMFEDTSPGAKPSDDAYHLYQSKQMLALGGRVGSIFGGDAIDDLTVYRLPEAHCDFVYCMLGERFGWIGTGGVLVLFALLIWRGLSIAQASREPFGRLVAVGLVSLVGVQVLVNAGMTVGLSPITGLSMPLVSYGGSGLLAHGLALGLLLNIGLRPGYHVTNEPFRFETSRAAG